MLKFDLNQNPPTAEELAIEQKRTIRIFLLAGAVLILSIIGLRWVGFTMTPGNEGVILGWFMDGVYALYLGAVVVIFLTFALLCGFGPLSGALVVVFFLALIFGLESMLLAPRMWMDLAAAGDSGGATLVAALTLACIIAAIVAIWVPEKNTRLDNIHPSACDQLIADCLADPLCEQYRQKIAALGRKPVFAEAKMVRKRVAAAEAREKRRR